MHHFRYCKLQPSDWMLPREVKTSVCPTIDGYWWWLRTVLRFCSLVLVQKAFRPSWSVVELKSDSSSISLPSLAEAVILILKIDEMMLAYSQQCRIPESNQWQHKREWKQVHNPASHWRSSGNWQRDTSQHAVVFLCNSVISCIRYLGTPLFCRAYQRENPEWVQHSV